jgi:hypothetical protein
MHTKAPWIWLEDLETGPFTLVPLLYQLSEIRVLFRHGQGHRGPSNSSSMESFIKLTRRSNWIFLSWQGPFVQTSLHFP